MQSKPHPVPNSDHSATGYRNIYPAKQAGRYFVLFRLDGHRINLGTFDTLEQAVDARQQFIRTFYPL